MKDKFRKKLELLAPAGSFESLKAAVLNGADAVYLGGGRFNARINAGNFTEEDLPEALDFAHERGAKIYITLNTLLKNDELEDALQFAAFVYEQGADAVIVQDQGLIRLLRRSLPGLAVHASTQMTLTNTPSIAELEALGVKRAVLARELTLEEIAAISAGCRTELEVFVHGALCVCYSGQCLMSSFIGGRSGNRGLCAQPCRLPWSLSRNGGPYGKSAYLLSPRDLMAIDLLPELKKAGVTSLKLEGRMKSPEYVAVITSVYRTCLDRLEASPEEEYRVEEIDRKKLAQAFNRGGFTRGYLEDDRSFTHLVYPEHPKNQGILLGTVLDTRPLYVRISLAEPLHRGDGLEIMDEDSGPQSLIVTDILQNGSHTRDSLAGESPWVGDIKTPVKKGSKVYKTMSRALFDEARQTYGHGEAALVPLDMRFTLKTGEKAGLEIRDDEGNRIFSESDAIAEKALNRPLSAQRIREQLQKTGDTPYFLRELQIDTDEESTIPVSALNALRRTTLEELKRNRIGMYKKSLPEKVTWIGRRIPGSLSGEKHHFPGNDLALSAYFYESPSDLSKLNGLVSRVYLPLGRRDELEKLRNGFRGELFLWTPAVLKNDELVLADQTLVGLSDLWDGIAYGNLGTLRTVRQRFPEKQYCADFSMNLFNEESMELQRTLGAQSAVLSPELRLSEVEDLHVQGLTLEALVYGRLPLMTMEYCPSSLEPGCTGQCASCGKRRGALKDRMGQVFPFTRDPVLKRTQIFNSMILWMDDIPSLKRTDLKLLRLSFTDGDADAAKDAAGCFHRKLEGLPESPEDREFIQKLKDQGFTKGHWFRGV